MTGMCCFAAMEKGKPCHGLWDHPANRLIFETLKKWAVKLDCSCYVLGQAWLLAQPFEVFPVAAVSRREQIMDFEAICHLRMPEECLQDIHGVLCEAEHLLTQE